jgi:hypothetical protein
MTALEIKEIEQWLKDVEAVKAAPKTICPHCDREVPPSDERCEQYRNKDRQVRLLKIIIKEATSFREQQLAKSDLEWCKKMTGMRT